MGMLKKGKIFLGETNSEVGIFLGIKYEPLSDPPVIKICGWGPWVPRSSNSEPCILVHYPVGNLFGDVFPFFLFYLSFSTSAIFNEAGKRFKSF